MKYKVLLFFTVVISFTSCNRKTVVFHENFNNNSNHWDLINTESVSNKIENGTFILSSKIDNVINLSLIQSDYLSENISLTASIKVEKFYDQDGLAGIILFADDQKFPTNYLFFGVNNQSEILISKESKNINLSQTFYRQINKIYKPDQINEFSISTNENSIQFSVNETPIITIPKPISLGYFYGFIVLDSKIITDDLIVKLSK